MFGVLCIPFFFPHIALRPAAISTGVSSIISAIGSLVDRLLIFNPKQPDRLKQHTQTQTPNPYLLFQGLTPTDPRQTNFKHRQTYCPRCDRLVVQAAEGELPNCDIGPATKAAASFLRYGMRLSYRKGGGVEGGALGSALKLLIMAF